MNPAQVTLNAMTGFSHLGRTASVAFVAVAMVSAGLACGSTQPDGPDDVALGPQTNPNLKHFGFALVDVGFDDPLDTSSKTNYSDEVAGFTNLADVLVASEADDIRNRVRALNALGMKALLHLNDLFFEANGTSAPSGANYSLRSNYASRWDRFVALNAAVLDTTAVQVLYIGEEPTWNGISYLELKAATDLIKLRVALVPILIVEAYPAISGLRVPTSVDWVGFDHYFLKDPTRDPTFLAELAAIKSKRSTGDQRVVLIMDSFYSPLLHGQFGISESDMGRIAAGYYSLAVAEPDVVAVIGYVWPGGFDGPEAKGARQFSAAVQRVYREMGKRILNR